MERSKICVKICFMNVPAGHIQIPPGSLDANEFLLDCYLCNKTRLNSLYHNTSLRPKHFSV